MRGNPMSHIGPSGNIILAEIGTSWYKQIKIVYEYKTLAREWYNALDKIR